MNFSIAKAVYSKSPGDPQIEQTVGIREFLGPGSLTTPIFTLSEMHRELSVSLHEAARP
jgi:hypothetical protein